MGGILSRSAISLSGIRKSFGEVTVLDGIDLRVDAGQVLTMVGGSGSGKSTLLRCVNFLEVPDSGKVEVFGHGTGIARDARGNPQPKNPREVRAIRQLAGMVFQDFNLWPHRSVLQNVTEPLIYALRVPAKAARERAMVALEQVDMATHAARYPMRLSGGQKQRVAIARAIAMQPKVILFDEPTSALDPEMVGEVLKVIGKLVGTGATILMITHEMSFAREVSDRIIFLHEGRIARDAPPQEFFRNPEHPGLRRFLEHLR